MNIFLPKNWASMKGQFPILIDTRQSKRGRVRIFNKALSETFKDFYKSSETPYEIRDLGDMTITKLLEIFSKKEINIGSSIISIYISKEKVTARDVCSILEYKELEKREVQNQEDILNRKYRKRNFLLKILRKTG